MKKITSALLLLSLLLILLTGCKKYYDPIESTEEESRVVMTMTAGDATYEIKYELFRALFLTHKSTIDGGDDTVWQGENRDEYVARANEVVIGYISEIYSVFEAARRAGLDVFSDDVEKEIKEYVKIGVEGGSIGGIDYSGYSSYDEYLAALRALNLNYSVQALMLRYSIAIDMLDEYYIGTVSGNDIENGVISQGAIKYTKEDVRTFYESDRCVRVLRTFVNASMVTNPYQMASRIRNAALAASSRGEEAVRDAMIGAGSTTAEAELARGYLVGRYNLSRLNYGEMIDAAFLLEVGEVSPVVKASEGNELYYYVLYRAEKTDSYYEDNYSQVAYIYLRNTLGEILEGVRSELATDVLVSDYLKTLDYSAISMN